MSETMMQEVLNRLDAIGAKLGEGGAFVWEAMMRQVFWVGGVLTLLFAVVLAVASFGAYRLWWHYNQIATEEKGKGYLGSNIRRQMDAEQVAGFSVVGCVASAIAAAVFLFYGLAHIVNPTYYALMELAKLVGK